MQLADLGERGLLALLAPYFGRGGAIRVPVGDDAAVIAVESGELVATTDLLFEDVHFSEATTAPYDVGWRAATANLSDLAAMGAAPLGLLVGLGLPVATPVDWVTAFYDGLTACATPRGAGILGGDTCRSRCRTVAITALGSVEPERILRRNAARPGDLLVVTGFLGDSRAGLEVLLHPERFQGAAPGDIEAVVRAHRRPVPRLEVPPLVWRCSERAAAMDTSDGLADAVRQVCAQSGCGARLATASLPVSQALLRLAPAQARPWALYGGEDFELLLSLPAAAAACVIETLGSAGLTATVVGEVTAEPRVCDEWGNPLAEPDFEHFS